jgi:uncharacterized protein DUF547
MGQARHLGSVLAGILEKISGFDSLIFRTWALGFAAMLSVSHMLASQPRRATAIRAPALVPRPLAHALWALLLASLVSLAGCGGLVQVTDVSEPRPERLSAGQFPHDLLDQVQSTFVDERGRVDYAALKAHPEALKRYLLWVERFSPQSQPWLFPSTADKLAYAINTHHAFVLFGVIQHYPIQSVNDVKAFVELKQGFGFFFAQKFVSGNETINLYGQVNHILRKFGDPRIHAVLNCGALSCPRLRRQAFHPETLDRDLDAAMRSFLTETRNLQVDHRAHVVFLSKVFDWFESDFTQYAAAAAGGSIHQASLLDYVAMFTDGPLHEAVVNARRQHYSIVFRDYDWRLNDKGAQGGPPL